MQSRSSLSRLALIIFGLCNLAATRFGQASGTLRGTVTLADGGGAAHNVRVTIIQRTLTILMMVAICGALAAAQSLGSAGTVEGAVMDPAQAVVVNATVTLANPVTGFKRTVTTDTGGAFRFTDVPPNNYQLNVSAEGLQPRAARCDGAHRRPHQPPSRSLPEGGDGFGQY